jgi:hypothetical protein
LGGLSQRQAVTTVRGVVSVRGSSWDRMWRRLYYSSPRWTLAHCRCTLSPPSAGNVVGDESKRRFQILQAMETPRRGKQQQMMPAIFKTVGLDSFR